MSRILFKAAGPAALLFAFACGDPSATGLQFEKSEFALSEGQTVDLKVFVEYDDGTKENVTSDVQFTFEGDSVAVDAGKLLGAVAGEAKITATMDDLSGTATAKVAEAPVEALQLETDGELMVGTTVQLKAIGTWESGHSHELHSGVTFTSSDERVATIDEHGMVTVVAGGPVTFTAEARGTTATVEAKGTCEYPKFSPELEWNRVIPNLGWPAKYQDGVQFDFSMGDVYCNADWENIKTLTVILSAGWCTPCTMYAQRLEQEYEQLKAYGMEIITIEVQDTEGLPANLDFAYRHLDRITGTFAGIAAGDADTRPQAGFLQNSEILRAFPTVIVVRTSDMRIIADQNRSTTYLPLAAIAQNPDADWSNPGSSSFENNCGGQADESTTNHDPASAMSIAPGTIEGGICEDKIDFFTVDVDGDWTIEMTYPQEVGDLDVFVWDAERSQPLQINGQLIGSTGSTGTETFNHTGRVLVAVQGYQHASAPYTLTLTER